MTKKDSHHLIATSSTELSSWLVNPYVKAATADNTRTAYRSDIRHFERWGGLLPAQTEAIVQYLQCYASELNARTLTRRVTAIKQWHLLQEFPDPTSHPVVRKMLKGIARIKGRPAQKAHAITLNELEKILTPISAEDTLIAARDNALLQVGYFAALRRSELVDLCVEDLTWVEEGVIISIRQAKTDSDRQGQLVSLPYGTPTICPVQALKRWLTVANIQAGFIFRRIKKGSHLQVTGLSATSVNLILKQRAVESGFNKISTLSSHSLRRGLTTAASRADSKLAAIMRHGRWKNLNTVLEYIDAADRFKENVVLDVINHQLKD